MLTVAYRFTEQIPLYQAIETFIVKYHGPNEFDNVKVSVKQLHDLREEIAKLTSYDDAILLQKYNEMLIEYYVGLKFLQEKFKFGDEKDAINLAFTWTDSNTQEKKRSPKVALELNSILYNLGAVISNTRTPIEGENIKIVSQKFQEAAWVFDHLKESSKDLQASTRTHDFTAENLLFLSTLQLAQSQYCFFKKADTAKMSPTVMTKICNQLQ